MTDTQLTDAEIAEVRDRLEIRALVDSYAFCVDSREHERTAGLFTPDGVLRIFERNNPVAVRERFGRAEITTAMEGLTRYEFTIHFVGNHRSEIDGDEATGETYCVANHVRNVDEGGGPDGRANYVMHVRYLDRYTRTNEGWKINQRHLMLEFTEDRPVTGP